MEDTESLDPCLCFLFLGASRIRRTCPLTVAFIVLHISDNFLRCFLCLFDDFPNGFIAPCKF